MSPVKITALILGFAAAAIGLYFIFKNDFSAALFIPDNFERNKSNKSQEVISAPLTFNSPPLRWFKDINEKTEIKIKDEAVNPAADIQQIEEQINSLWQKITVPIEPSLPPLSSSAAASDIPFVSEGEMNVRADGAENSAEYYANFIDFLKAITFTDAERETMKKDEDGRILLLEELFDEAISNGDLSVLRQSFAGWRSLDEKILAELAKTPINRKMISTNRLLMGWYRYHSGIAKKLGGEELNREKLEALRGQFKKNAEIHNSGFRASVASLKNSSNFSFLSIPEAKAFTCGSLIPLGFYNFGGRVIPPILICGLPPIGVIYTITPPCGGLLLFPYPVLALNPYLWKTPIIGSVTLGKSMVKPGGCFGIGVGTPWPYYVYEAIVLYFGTSLIP